MSKLIQMLKLLQPPNIDHLSREWYTILPGSLSWGALSFIVVLVTLSFVSNTWNAEATRALVAASVWYTITTVFTNLSLK